MNTDKHGYGEKTHGGRETITGTGESDHYRWNSWPENLTQLLTSWRPMVSREVGEAG